MPQNKEATEFLSRIAGLPNGPVQVALHEVLQPSLQDEGELRKLFAADKGNARLKDIHVGLVDIFAASSDIRTTRARVVKDDADRDAQHVLALPTSLRREEGSPAMVENLEAFEKNWDVFTESSLSQLADWNNIIAAGGSVQACLMPLPEDVIGSKRAMRKYFHEKAFPSSDVDIFLYGLTADEAERKIIAIYEGVRDSVPWDVTCVRTKRAVSIHSQYPYRNIQIVLRLYSSPAEVLAGFDVDASCCAYDGDRVWANPRAIVSMMRQSNTVDMMRGSPSYEVRLAKYSSRGFEVYVPGLKRDEIDPTIYERGMGRVTGLARLLAIEMLATREAGIEYQNGRSVLRGRPTLARPPYLPRGRKHTGDLKANEGFSGLKMSDYDVVNLHIPYGLRWDARRIERHIYKTDFNVNFQFSPKNKNRRLHRHFAFYGTAEDCIKGGCECCPEPKNEEETILRDEEDKVCVRGRISFIEENLGRQSISGRFNPIECEWSKTGYVQATARLLGAISKNDVLAVKQMIEDGEELNCRDQAGRTPLHVAIFSHSVEVGCVCIDAGARMTARLVGGRNSLHLAAQMGQVSLVKKMLERSAYNKGKVTEEKRKMEPEDVRMNNEDEDVCMSSEDEDGIEDEDVCMSSEYEDGIEDEDECMSSEDDWSSEEYDDGKPHRKPPAYTKKDEPENVSGPLEDNEEEPDVLDTSTQDWDFGFTALAYAILSGSLEVVDALLAAGADPSFVTYANEVKPLYPLALTIYPQDEERAAKIAERLVAAQATSLTADDKLYTTFHRIVIAGKTKIVASLLAHDTNAKKVLNGPLRCGGDFLFPIVSTIMAGDYAMLSLLLAHGAKLSYSPEDLPRVEDKRKSRKTDLRPIAEYRAQSYLPLEIAIGKCDEVISLLAAIGADVDVPIMSSNRKPQRLSLLQWTSKAISFFESKIAPKPIQDLPDSPAGDTWSHYRAYLAEVLRLLPLGENKAYVHPREEYAPATKEYLIFAESILRAHGAGLPKEESIPEQSQAATGGIGTQSLVTSQGSGYSYGNYTTVPVHLKALYDELYEACWNGNDDTIWELCFPRQVGEGKQLIWIVVRTSTVGDPHGESGWTPFLVALHRHHWDTARLVLAIAKAQYQPRVDSSSSGGPDSNEEATAPPSVRTRIPPTAMLEFEAKHIHTGFKSCNPLQKAMLEDDFEAFVHTLDLYDFVGMQIRLRSGVYDLAVTLDRPEMLDEFIRREGVGIAIPSNPSDAEEDLIDFDILEDHEYLGLGNRNVVVSNVTVKPRRNFSHNYAFLRSAIRSGATKVIDYLAGPRPIAAFVHYAETHDDKIAQYVKSIDNLDEVFPELLDWKPDGMNETPLLCAVISDRLDILKQMFALKPSLMQEALCPGLRVRFVGFEALLTAAYYCSGTDIVGFLLEKGCDPTQRDTRGWNIYHVACLSPYKKRVKFVEYLLTTLPEKVTHELMAQTSEGALNTPLMLAVKRENAETARAILEFGIDPVVLLLRDVDGCTPLHVAAQKENTVLAELLLKYGPTQLLYIENCVGQTPLDIDSLKYLRRVTYFWVHEQIPNELHVDVELSFLRAPRPFVFNLEKQKREIPRLRATLDTLLADGSLVHGSKLTTELLAFADRMERRLAEETAREKAEEKQTKEAEPDPPSRRGTNIARMYFVLRDAAAARPGVRQLVNLADVQRSVQRSLARQPEGTFAQQVQLSRETDVRRKRTRTDTTALKERSMFAGYSYLLHESDSQQHANLFGEDRF